MDNCTTNFSFLNKVINFSHGTSTLIFPDFVNAHPYYQCSAIVAITLLLLYIYWNIFHRPYDIYVDFTEYGFEDVTNEKKGSDASRKNLINELRQRRKAGDLPPSYPNGWFEVIESDKLRLGTAKEVDVLGHNLVAWRGEKGKAYVADAYCPHIGAHLGVGGKVKGECIQCPFHSWAFDGEKGGKLTGIPYASNVPDFVKLKMWTTMETNGFIFIWYHAEKEEPTWFPDSVSEIDNGDWSYRGRSEFRIACHIQEILENGADVSHLNVLHSSTFLSDVIPYNSLLSLNFVKHIWSAKWRPNPDAERSHEALLKLEQYFELFGCIKFCNIELDIHQLGPGLVIMHFETIFGKAVFIQTVTPIEPLLQRVTHRIYSSSTFIHPIGKLCLISETKQIARDMRIWNRKSYVKKPILTKEDQTIKTFRRWFAQFYSENSPRHYFERSDDNNAKQLKF